MVNSFGTGHLSRCGTPSNTFHALDHLQTKLKSGVRFSWTPCGCATDWLAYSILSSNPPPSKKRVLLHRYIYLCVNVSLQYFCITYVLINYPDRQISTRGSNNVAVDSKNRERSLLRMWKQLRGSWRLNWWRWVNFPLVQIRTSTLLIHFASWTDNADSLSPNTKNHDLFFRYYRRGQRRPLPP